MKNNRCKFSPHSTSFLQRCKLFEAWEQTGNIADACRQANVSRGTFYRWRERFEEGGYDALKEYLSRRPHQPRRKPSETEALVIQLKRKNPTWGKAQIAKEVSLQLEGMSISPTTVRRILIDANLW